MQANPTPSGISRAKIVAAFGAALCLVGAWPVQASLGEGRDSIDADRRHFSARLSAIAASTHTVQVLTMPNGGEIREYVRSDGVVFALTWRGSARPDLRQLLGSRFDIVQADNVRSGGRRTRRPLVVRRSDFGMSTGGHSGAFWGVAYLPSLAPPGFSAKALT